MIYDIELFKQTISVELEELEMGDRAYEYKVDSLIKLLENFGCEQYFIDRRSWDKYALITMSIPDNMMELATADEEAFIQRIEEIVLMIFAEDGAARYLPPVFTSEMSEIKKLFDAIKKIEEKFSDPEDQKRELEKTLTDMGLDGQVMVQKIEEDLSEESGEPEEDQELPDLQMIELPVEVDIKTKTFSVVGFSGPMTQKMTDKYGVDISKIADEVSPNSFKPIDLMGNHIDFPTKQEFIEWISERFMVV